MTYRVTAPLVLARDKAGKVHHVYQNGLIDWLDTEQKRHFIDMELVEVVGAESDSGVDGGSEDGPPAKSDSKADWVDYAVASGYDRDEVEAMNKADIQALDFG